MFVKSLQENNDSLA